MFKINSSIKTKKFAFSLIELSIVILVISILVVGTTQGYNLVRSAQISNARGITAKSPISQMLGLLAWYETSLKESFNESQIKDEASISVWKDTSPNSILNGNNKLETASPSSNISYIRSGINKIPAVRFSGSSKLSLANFNQGPSSQATFFLVIKPNYNPDTTNYKTIFDGNSADFSFSIKNNNGSTYDGLKIKTATDPALGSSTGFSNSKEYAIAVYFNGSSSKVFINSTNSSSDINNSSGTNQLIGMTLGTDRTGSNGFSGFISEIVVFNRVIKTSERN